MNTQLARTSLFVQRTAASDQADAWADTRPDDAALMRLMAAQPEGHWVGDWTDDPAAEPRHLVTRAADQRAVPVIVLYNAPLRDFGGQHSSGGAAQVSTYLHWVGQCARGIGDRRALVILEPDALADLDRLPAADQPRRVQALREATRLLKALTGSWVYVDAGNPGFVPAQWMAPRLEGLIGLADGFALNVSNFFATAENIAFGEDISRRLGGAHFVIDTSRNGRGAPADHAWCNPPGRGLGERPTTQTGHELVDAYLWVKRPGMSDGRCNGGPEAGFWFANQARELALLANPPL